MQCYAVWIIFQPVDDFFLQLFKWYLDSVATFDINGYYSTPTSDEMLVKQKVNYLHWFVVKNNTFVVIEGKDQTK